MVTALGITLDGKKVVLGFVETSTENETVCTEFLRGLVDRGLSFEKGLLVALDGAKGLRKAVARVFAGHALVQRCQWHKRENVVRYLGEAQKQAIRGRMQHAYDDISSDGVGFEPVLGNLLTADKEYPVGVVKEGVSGTSSADGAASTSSTLAKYPTAKYYLIMFGTNDAYIPPILSGVGLIPGDPGYYGSFKDNMQRIVSAILAAGKTPYLAEIPYTSDPLRRNEMIYEYNAAIDELVITNNILVTPPSFYAYFMNHQGELADGIHPNGTGYQSMANLWFGALTN